MWSCWCRARARSRSVGRSFARSAGRGVPTQTRAEGTREAPQLGCHSSQRAASCLRMDFPAGKSKFVCVARARAFGSESCMAVALLGFIPCVIICGPLTHISRCGGAAAHTRWRLHACCKSRARPIGVTQCVWVRERAAWQKVDGCHFYGRSSISGLSESCAFAPCTVPREWRCEKMRTWCNNFEFIMLRITDAIGLRNSGCIIMCDLALSTTMKLAVLQ